jgi:hypothetical protein
MQTSVSAQSGQWYEGQITRPIDIDDKSALNEDATAMKIGYPIIAGTDPNTQAKKPTAAFTFDNFLGIIHSAVGISEKALSTGNIDIVTNQGLSYLRKGYMAVLCSSLFTGLTITKNENVYAAYNIYGDSTQWTFRNSDDLLSGNDVSFVVSSGVCTVTDTAHGLTVGQTVVISDSADLPGLNGPQVVASVPTANTFTFATTEADDTGHTLDYTTGGASKIPAIFTKSGTVAAGGTGIFEIRINADMSIGVS